MGTVEIINRNRQLIGTNMSGGASVVLKGNVNGRKSTGKEHQKLLGKHFSSSTRMVYTYSSYGCLVSVV